MIIRNFAHHHPRQSASLAQCICALLLIGAPLAAQMRAATPTAAQLIDSTTAPLRLDRNAAITEALAHNPTLAVAREQIAQARARVTEGYALPEPSVSANYLGANGAFHPHTGNETDLGIGITIPFPNKIILRGQAAKSDLGNFDELYVQQRQLIASQTAQAYDSLLVALRHREDLLISKSLAEDFVKKTEARYSAGTVAKLDIVKGQVDVAQAENDLIANERGIANARAGLNRLLGRVLGASVEPTDTLGVPTVPADFARLEKLALELRPELRGLQRQRQSAKAQERLAQQYFLPDVTLGLSRNNIYGEDPTYTTSIGIDLPIFFWQHQKGEVAEAKHRELELTESYRDVIAQVGQDLRNSYATASTALRQVQFLTDRLVPSAEEQYRIASSSYGLGGSSALEVIDAQRTLLDARNQYTTALGALNDAVADLERATGAPLDSTPDEKSHE
ncbi:MAG: TolC family protein [Gemmatimonadota bacterium]|nr:TolC family protein [Gemmatimonadota bacterium]